MKKVLLLVTLVLSITSCTSFEVNTVKDCKVKELQQQQLITSENGSMKTEIRYLVITDKETFICESSFLNGKFDNSNVFFNLQKDSTYTFKVEGYGKSFFYDYRNILEVVK